MLSILYQSFFKMRSNLVLILLFFIFKAEAQTSALSVADSLYAVGEYSQAIIKLQNITPKREAIYLKLAENMRQSGKWEAALQNYEKVLQKNPNRVLTALNYGNLLLKSNHIDKADSLFTTLEKNYPRNASFKVQLGIIKQEQHDSTALDYFREAVKLDPYQQKALYQLAKNALQNSDFDQATTYCLKGLTRNDKNSQLLSLLAQTYFNRRYYFLAVKPFEKLLSLNKGTEYVHSSLGLCYYEMHDFQKAINQYKIALTFNDKSSSTYYILGKLYAYMGELQKSEAHLLKSIEISDQPLDAEFLSLATTYKLQENYKLMLEYAQKALQENPDNERALYERAFAADNYYKDLETRKTYYQQYLDKYEEEGNEALVYLAKNRISDISKEIHMSK